MQPAHGNARMSLSVYWLGWNDFTPGAGDNGAPMFVAGRWYSLGKGRSDERDLIPYAGIRSLSQQPNFLEGLC